MYKNTSDPSNATIADFNLPDGKRLPPSLFVDQTQPSDVCWCIPYAIFDASVGIEMAVNAFCTNTIVFSSTHEFGPVKKIKRTARRGYEGQSMFKSV